MNEDNVPSAAQPSAPVKVAAAWLTAATTDLRAFMTALARQMQDALPPGQVQVRRRFVRFLPPSRVIAVLTLCVGEWHYTIDNQNAVPRFLRAPDARGVALQAQDIGVAEWLVGLERDLVAHAARVGAAGAALRNLLDAAPPAIDPAPAPPPPQTRSPTMPSDPAQGGLPEAALRRLQAAGERRAFTSNLTINEYAMLSQVGFVPVSMVLGSSIYHVGLQIAGFRTNQEIEVGSQAMYHARELAMQRMTEEAARAGADGVISVHLQIHRLAWSPHVLEFVAIGTAVRHAQGQAGFKGVAGRPFTSHLSGQDFWTLLQTGSRPLAMVMGCCVYHIAHQSMAQVLRNLGRNAEVPEFTQAYYNSRELAMERMQREADAEGASGIVGVQLSQSSHVWEAHVVEFFAVGTAVTTTDAVPTRTDALRPQPVLPLSG
jgi:uncharacterized protein YbjQ (UPF0145 family)